MKECDQKLEGINIPNCESMMELENDLVSKIVDKINQRREDLLIEGLKLKGYDFKIGSKEFYEFLKENVSREGSFESETYYLNNVPFLEMSTNTVIDNPMNEGSLYYKQLTTHKFL